MRTRTMHNHAKNNMEHANRLHNAERPRLSFLEMRTVIIRRRIVWPMRRGETSIAVVEGCAVWG